MNKLAVLIFIFYSIVTCAQDDPIQLLKKTGEVYSKAASFEIDIKMTIQYDGLDSGEKGISLGKIVKDGRKAFQDFNEIIQIKNENEIFTMNKRNKTCTFQNVDYIQNLQIQDVAKSIEKLNSELKLKKLGNGNIIISDGIPEDLNCTFLLELDGDNYTILKYTYFILSEKNKRIGTAVVEYLNTKVNQKVSKEFFDMNKYISKNKKEVKMKEEYSEYNLL